jgi:hypothetical protein
MCDREQDLMMAYLGADPAGRRQLELEHPDFFVDEVQTAVQEADALQRESAQLNEEMRSMVNGLKDELDLPDLAGLEAGVLPDSEGTEYFQRVLAGLMSAMPPATLGTLTSPTGPSPKAHRVTIVLPLVVEFLPIRSVLKGTEGVCRGWRAVTKPTKDDAGMASALWIGMVQREYPAELAELIEGDSSSSIINSNWRTIARVIST